MLNLLDNTSIDTITNWFFVTDNTFLHPGIIFIFNMNINDTSLNDNLFPW